MFRNGSNYFKITTSIIVNNFGDVLFDLFIVWKITRKTGDIMSAVYLIGSSILFRAVLSVFTGFLVDRFDKKKMIVVSNLFSAAIIIFFASLYNVILTSVGVGVFLILLNDINNEVFGRSALVMSSELFDQAAFIKFRAFYSVINRVVVIAGASAAGFLIAWVPVAMIFAVDVATFLISALCIAMVNYPKPEKAVTDKSITGELIRIKTDVVCVWNEMRTNSFIIKFIVLMFILNLAYGYIPYILPVKIANESLDPTLLGMIKSAIAAGEIVGLLAVSFFAEKVSLLFKISMIGIAVVLAVLCYSRMAVIAIACFLLYGGLDSITQPLFSYTVSVIDEKNRGKIMGGIDAIILLSPSAGMFVITKVMERSVMAGYAVLIMIFIVGFLVIRFSKELNGINLKNK